MVNGNSNITFCIFLGFDPVFVLPQTQARISPPTNPAIYPLIQSFSPTQPISPSEETICNSIPDGFTLFARMFDTSNCYTVNLFLQNQVRALYPIRLTVITLDSAFIGRETWA